MKFDTFLNNQKETGNLKNINILDQVKTKTSKNRCQIRHETKVDKSNTLIKCYLISI